MRDGLEPCAVGRGYDAVRDRLDHSPARSRSLTRTTPWPLLACLLFAVPAAAQDTIPAVNADPARDSVVVERVDDAAVTGADRRTRPTAAASAAADTTPSAAGLTTDERVDAYVQDLVDPRVGVTALALGLYDHVRTVPDEWGGGADALTKRVLARAGGHVVSQSVRHGLAAALGRTTRYQVCGCASTDERIVHAIYETLSDRDVQGRRRLSTPTLAGAYAGALAPVIWHPDADAAEALQSGTLSLLFSVIGNVVRELTEPYPPN